MKKYLLTILGIFAALGSILVLTVYAMPLVGLGNGQIPAVADAVAVIDQDAETGQVAAADVVIETVPEVSDDYAVVAEAVVAPVEHTTLSMAASGIVAEVLAKEGQVLEAGQMILRLQSTHQQAAVAQAEAGLANAQAGLAALEAGPRAQEIAAARSNLEAAQARLARLEEGARQEDVDAARSNLTAAQAILQRLYDGPDDHTRIAAEAELANAQAALRQAQAAYDPVADRGDIGMLPQSLQLEQATTRYEAAKANYDALFAEPDADLVAGAKAQIKNAQANLERLLEPATENEIAEARAGVRGAQAQLELLEAGARDEEIASAAASVAEAEAALQQAQASLDDTVLRAPVGGTLAALHVKTGEQVAAGHPVAELADLSKWQIETDDLTELDVINVTEGDRVVMTFDAIPGLELGGSVVRIKPIGEEKLGDITYTVIVQPDEQDPRLRWNMTAVVTIP